MASRSRLVLLTGLVALGAAVYAVVALVREDVPAAEAAAAAYLADWSAGDFTALEDRVVEYVDHLHEHFTDPAEVRGGRYVAPTAPGYSITMRPDSIERFRFPGGEAWTRPVAQVAS